MAFFIGFVKKLVIIWIGVVIVMLPGYFRRKKNDPSDAKNTLIAIFVKALIISVILNLILGVGFFMMYFEELKKMNF